MLILLIGEMMAKVSVIVPVWNVEKYLDNCLKSLINQTLDDIEILVINDDSPDHSQIIIDNYVKKYPNKLFSFFKENGGQGSARNLGMDKAKGEYIAFVDSDDYVDLKFCEKLYNKAKKMKADIVICDMIEHYPTYDTYYDCTNFKNKFSKTPSVCNKLFSRKLIDNTRFYVENKMWYEDLNFTSKILLKTDKIEVVNEGLYHIIVREVSTMRNSNAIKNLDMLVALENIKIYMQENGLWDENHQIFESLVVDHVLVSSINRVSRIKSKDKKMVISKMLEYTKKTVKNYKATYYYKTSKNNKKIIAILNYNKLHSVGSFLSILKSLMIKRKI